MNEKIEQYIKQIELQINKELITEVFNFIIHLNTNDIIGIEGKLASLFCRTIEKIQKLRLLDNEIESLITKAFNNIDTMPLNNEGTSELKTLYLLKILYDSRTQHGLENIPNLLSDNLLDNLEKIQILFSIKYENNKFIFPVSKFLFPIIKSENLLNEIQNPQVIQALMLALSIFNTEQKPTELEEIKKLIRQNNLKFIDYLFDDSERLFGYAWKENFEYNGTLVLYNKKLSKILIRNPDKDYFKIDSSLLVPYKQTEIEIKEEINSNKSPIAYYVEYNAKSPTFITFEEEFIDGEEQKNLKLLQIIYNKSYFNVLLSKGIIRIDDDFYPTNPYSINDKFCIFTNSHLEYSLISINQYLRKYNLIKLGGKGLNYINLGMLIEFQKINKIAIDGAFINKNTTFIDFLTSWLANCKNKQEAFNLFLKSFTEQLKFVQNKEDLLNQTYQNQFWLPIQLTSEILQKLDFSPVITESFIIQCKISKDVFTDSIEIKNTETKEILSDFKVENISGDELIIRDNPYNAVLDEKNKILYVGNEIELYANMLKKINETNLCLLPNNFLSGIEENDIETIIKYMKLFKVAFNEKHPSIPLDSIARYRLIFHLLLLYTTDFKFDNWKKLITRHEYVDFSMLHINNCFQNTDGILFVIKDRARKQSTLKQIFNSKLNEVANRSVFDFYDQRITKNSNSYCLNNNKIKSICFVFDLVQNGMSSYHTINYYINQETVDKDNPQFTPFFCNNQRILLTDIIKSNKIKKIDVICFFASQEGLEKIKEVRMPEGYTLNVKEPLKLIIHKLTEDENVLIDNIYKRLRGEIGIGDYLIVREYNQPVKNIMSNELMDLDKIVAIFLRKSEIK